MKSIVILISGRGSNMEALLDAVTCGELPVRVAAVLSNRPDAEGLKTAASKGIPVRVVDHKAFASREAFDAALAEEITQFSPDLVVLAGFMRLLSAPFVDAFAGRLINIHPSLLPVFTGLHTHQQALDVGVRVHGCTVHFVTALLDHGPIIIQAAVPVLGSDNAASLAARVLLEEHKIYPLAVRWFVEDAFVLVDGKVVFTAPRATRGVLISP